MTIGETIKRVRTSLNMTQKDFAKSVGIAQGFLSAIEQGKKQPSNTLLIALQHLYKLDPLWAESTDNTSMAIVEEDTLPTFPPMAAIPFYSRPLDTVSALTPPAKPDRHVLLPRIPRNCFAFEYSGEYMLPTIRDKDIIVVDPNKRPVSGTIALIVGKWGEPLLRRYRTVKGEKYFTADNSNYSPFPADSSIRILGTVVQVWREISI